jgi:hypothetical protein
MCCWFSIHLRLEAVVCLLAIAALYVLHLMMTNSVVAEASRLLVVVILQFNCDQSPNCHAMFTTNNNAQWVVHDYCVDMDICSTCVSSLQFLYSSTIAAASFFAISFSLQ